MNQVSQIYWNDETQHPAPTGVMLLFLLKGQWLCMGTKEYDAHGEPIWKDNSDCDSDGMPRAHAGTVTHWAIMPEFNFEH